MHWIFTNHADSQHGFRINMATKRELNDLDSEFLAIIPQGDGETFPSNEWWGAEDPDWDRFVVDLKDYIGRWVCIEYRMVVGSDYKVTLTEWFDGVQTRGPITGPGQRSPENYFSCVIFSTWENTAQAHLADFYIDDIVIADSYIGPNVLGKSNGISQDQIKKINEVYSDLLSKRNGYTIQGS